MCHFVATTSWPKLDNFESKKAPKLRTNTINNNNVLTQTGTGLHSASRISRLLWKDAK